jgi:hypothetical protein
MTDGTRGQPQPVKRMVLHFRVKIDSEMGEAYEILSTISPRLRAREAVFRIRRDAEANKAAAVVKEPAALTPDPLPPLLPVPGPLPPSAPQKTTRDWQRRTDAVYDEPLDGLKGIND